MSYTPTLTILNAVKVLLDSLKLTDADDSPALFEETRLYDATQVDRAFADLFLARQRRVCFVMPGKQTFRSDRTNDGLTTYKVASFALLICDSDQETGVAAAFGGPNNTGVVGIADRVVEKLTGASLGLSKVMLQPEEGDDFVVFDEKNVTDPGRKGWLQVFSTDAGQKGVRRSLTPENTPT